MKEGICSSLGEPPRPTDEHSVTGEAGAVIKMTGLPRRTRKKCPVPRSSGQMDEGSRRNPVESLELDEIGQDSDMHLKMGEIKIGT